MNRLKKKLVDCKEFYEAKCANSVQFVTLERKDWFENMAKYACLNHLYKYLYILCIIMSY